MDGRVRLFPANHRYAWPSELDLMARLGGMRLDRRWESWHGTPFTDNSTGHVSLWQKVSDTAWCGLSAPVGDCARLTLRGTVPTSTLDRRGHGEPHGGQHDRD